MTGNVKALALSSAYLFGVLILVTLWAKIKGDVDEKSRKAIHILLGNWVFFTPLFEDLWALLLMPFLFIFVNYFSLKFKIIKAMERDDDSYGTVYYAISLFALSYFAWKLNWPALAYIGILTMAYADGLAALVGKAYGKVHPFRIAPEKTVAGTQTVFAVTLIVTALSLFYFNGYNDGMTRHHVQILLIAFFTAVVTAFIELTGENGCDNITVPVGAALTAYTLFFHGNWGFSLFILVVIAILYGALKLKALTGDGVVAAFLTALTLYAFGGIYLGLSLLVFFILGSAISKVKNTVKEEAETLQDDSGARNWIQVVSNSLPACILVWVAILRGHERLALFLGFVVFAAAAADTFSSELGMLGEGKVFNILTGKPLHRGVSGGISWLGLLWGLLGSFLLALVALPVFGMKEVLWITLMGFAASIIDSVLGAGLQRKYLGQDGKLQDKQVPGQKPAKGWVFMTNSLVNLLSISLVTLPFQAAVVF